ncbi:MAG: hypothetical protein HDR82_09570 [Bacteroides sp.]|nr:hypothetical protein [Bacteroides sp.]
MTDYIMLPRAWLANGVIHDPNLSRLLLYLLGKVNDNGEVKFNTTELTKEFGWSRQQSRTLISKLKNITEATTKSNSTATTLLFDIQTNKQKRQPRQQPPNQPQKTADKHGYERFMDFFNETVANTSIPTITKLTDARKKALLSIFKEYDKETVVQVIRKAVASDFLSREWGKAGFDWIFKKANFIKILEGNYDNKPTSTTRDTAVSRKEQRDRGLSLANTIVSNSDDLLSLYYDTSADTNARKD